MDKNEDPINKARSISPNTRSNYFQQDQQKNQEQQSHKHNYFTQNKQIKKVLQNKSQIINQQYIPNTPQFNSNNQNNDLFIQAKKSQIQLLLADSNLKIYDNICLQQQKYDYLLLSENLLFYFKQCPIEVEKSYYKLDGKLYQTHFDENKNPKFIIQEGSFQVFLSTQRFQLNGYGKEYVGKSTTIKNQGQFEIGYFKEDEGKIQRSKSAPIKKIIIIDVQTGQQVNRNNQVKNYLNQFLYSESWCKFNQQFCQKDICILQNSGRLTSSIIDAYVLYLNLESERTYFQKEKSNRQSIYRILFLPTTLTTNFGTNYTDQHSKELFETELLQFQELNYELKYIYSQVGIPVNQKNYHWYFLHFDLKHKICTIFDSLQKPTSQMNVDQKLISTLEKLLKIQNCKKQFSPSSGQQIDGYSCGYHVCQFMKYCKESQFQSNVIYNYNQSEIQQTLLKIIKQ